jgi:hypothetical protein
MLGILDAHVHLCDAGFAGDETLAHRRSAQHGRCGPNDLSPGGGEARRALAIDHIVAGVLVEPDKVNGVVPGLGRISFFNQSQRDARSVFVRRIVEDRLQHLDRLGRERPAGGLNELADIGDDGGMPQHDVGDLRGGLCAVSRPSPPLPPVAR